MTRINCIPVTELTNKHLLAEYRELPRVFKLARPCPDAPTEYVLGAGHVKFFYTKLRWCYLRQVEIVKEMKQRGFQPVYDPNNLLNSIKIEMYELWGDWEPTEKAMMLNRARIQERLNKGENND